MTGLNRRRYLATASLLSLGLASGCQTPSPRPEEVHPVGDAVTSWPSFRGGRYNTGFARDASPTSSDPAVEWTFDGDGPFWGGPAVVDDTVYIGGADESVYALDARTGSEQWSFQTGHRVEATPAYGSGTVYVGSYDQHVYAIDAERGTRRWKRDVGGLVRGSATVWDGDVYVGVGCHNLACAWYADESEVTENGWVYSLDAKSGETNWRFDAGDEVVSTPAVADDTVYVGGSNGRLYALDAASGEERWSHEVRDMIWSSPAVAFGTVYFADWDGNVHAVNASSGRSEWTADTAGQYISGSVAVDEEGVYVGHTPYNTLDDPTTNHAKLFKFDRTDGAERWSVETPALEIGSSPVVTNDRVYVGTHRQTEGPDVGVHALTTDGREEWFLEIGGRGVGSSPALVDGTLYFGGTDGSVYAVE